MATTQTNLPNADQLHPSNARVSASNSNAKEIRLLTLLPPGESPDEIRCTLSAVTLSNPPEYEALSYCWGDESITLPVSCDQGRVMVTENLFSALRTLRRSDTDGSRTLWIDAICIDQSDAAAKADQIPLMPDIYRAARRVLIWLGPASHDSPNAIALVQEVAQIAASTQHGDYQRVLIDNMKARGLNIMDPIWSALVAMLARDWFGRAWIIQELAVARDAVVLCGDDECSWWTFQESVYKTGLLGIPAILDNKSLYQRLVQVHSIRESVQRGQPQKLFQLLLEARRQECKLPEDKIFSLCGLANDVGTSVLDVRPKYDGDPAVLYHQVALKMLRQDSHLEILSVPRVSQPSKVGKLPSWVPDWSVGDATFSLRSPVIPGGEPWNFRATPPNGEKSVLEIDDETIAISCQNVDEVFRVGAVLNGDPFEEDGPILESNMSSVISRRVAVNNKLQHILNSWEEIAEPRTGGRYPATGEDLLDAYWQTIAAGQVEDHEIAKQEFLRWDKVRRILMHLAPPDSGWMSAGWALMKMAVKMALLMLEDLLFSGGIGSTVSRRWAFAGRMMISNNRCLFKTKMGYLGVGPSLLREGDRIVLAKGGMVPLVLRAVDNTKVKWKLVGDAYMHGIMHGEIFDETKGEETLIV